MATFVCKDTATTYKVYDENFSILYNGTLIGGIFWFACNKDDGYFYVSENAVLTKRSLTDGTLIATEFESVGAQKPIVVDKDGYLWTIDNTPSNVIRKWASDLSSRTDYTIKAGVIDDYISNMVMTYDGNYVYLAGGHGTLYPSENNVKIAKLSVDDLSGDAEWEIELFHEGQLSYFYVVSMAVDESNDLYICGRYWDGTCVSKISGTDGSVPWAEGDDSAPLEEGYAHYVATSGVSFYVSYSQGTQSVYAFSYGNDFIGYFKQYSSDGAIVGSSAGYSGYRPTCCAVYDDDLLFAGTTYKTTLNGIYTFDITDNWGGSEAADTNSLLIKKPIWATGDPTGYLHYEIDNYAAPSTPHQPVPWERRFGIGQETNWSVGVNSEIPIPVINYPDFNISRITIESNHFSGLSYNNLVQKQRSYDAPKIQIEFDSVNDYLVYFFYTLFQRVWESGSSPYPKVFIPYDESPDFSAKSGSTSPSLLSIIGDNRIDGEGHKIDGALCSSLKLECGEGKILRTTVDLQGRDMVTNDSSSGDDFTSYSSETPLLWENATILMARSGATTGTQGVFSITSADNSQVAVSGDQTDYISNGNYLTFGITIGTSNDTIVITETAGSTVAVIISQGVYHPIELCLELQSEINSESGLANQYEVTFDIVSRKFLFTRDSGSDTFIIDEEDGDMKMNGTLGFDGSNDAAGTSYESDSAITWNVEAYEITNVAYSSSTTITVALDRDPTEGTLSQSILIWRKVNTFSMNLNFTNNVKSPVRNNTVVRQHILGRFEVGGSITIPWGLSSSDENLEINNFIAGYRTPMWIYWSGFGETDNDLAIFLNSFYTGSREISDKIVELELPFEATRDLGSDQINLPCFAIISDGDDKGWS